SLVTRLSGKLALLGREKSWKTPLHIDLKPKSISVNKALELLHFLKLIAVNTAVTVSLSHTGTPSYPWSNHGEKTVVTDLCFINLARVALRAGRGERARFSNILEVAIKLAIQALLAKRNLLEGKVFRPDLPLWQPEKNTRTSPISELPPATAFVHGLVPVGLTGAMSYLIGEPLGESVRGERLAEDVFREFRKQARSEGRKQRLRVGIYEACGSDSDMISRAFSQADLMGFPEAGELEAGSQGYEVGIPRVEGALKRKLTRALGLARSLDGQDLQDLNDETWLRWLKAGACLTTEESVLS
ncbi:MAG: anaerobic ribonucleoside-triphosphate reductase, partial [Planctomycetota bacterium]|nr:anaerobic ribonucleoside-triphosphate reductase [Planctomycetota bacterium]